MMRSVVMLLAFGLVAPPSGAAQRAPDRVFGIVLRQPLNQGAVSGRLCFTGRQLALEDGFYDAVTDDILFSVPDEHEDTAAVLAALDAFTACKARTRDGNATAIITLADSVVGHVLFVWPGGGAPTYDRMRATLTQAFGEPYQNSWGVQYWSADSMNIYVNKRSPYGDGTSVVLKDARVCERYEALMHHGAPHQPCWTKPERLDPGEIFTERPVALADSDLIVAKVGLFMDSAEVRRLLGAPISLDSVSWDYPDLRVSFASGHVSMITLSTPKLATARGLRVGDRVGVAKPLYGTPCIRELWLYCRTEEPDGRGIMLDVKDHVITAIRVGAVVVIR